ncbi:hypothetical protein ACFVFQ_02190 [Streptomyces sp. NPDC057743]|uniref:hypothetical protein n=1 Tax=Streptomyces sp. NPDC057743 TaxID=3346236 RepID=UPI0036BA74DE
MAGAHWGARTAAGAAADAPGAPARAGAGAQRDRPGAPLGPRPAGWRCSGAPPPVRDLRRDGGA